MVRSFAHALRLAVALCAAVLAVPAAASATTYYVAADGSDANSGTSPTQPLATLAAASALDLQPGDSLLLRGGDAFAGGLVLDAADSGTAGAPVTVGSYGSGRATVEAASGGDGILAYDDEHLTIQDLRIVGAGPLAGDDTGVSLSNDSGRDLSGFVLRRLDISGFHHWGVFLYGYLDGSTYSHVAMSELDVHDNGDGGLSTWTDPTDPNGVWPAVPVLRDIDVASSVFHDNKGYPGYIANPTGIGAVLNHVDGGRIHDTVAYGNGGLDNNPDYGPCALFTYESTQIRIDHNEAYDNHTGGPVDGCAFDLDDGVTDSVIEDNYSHDNDGAGLLWCNLSPTAAPGNVMRDNVSIGDGRRSDQGSVMVYERADGLRIEHNTVLGATTAHDARHPVLRIEAQRAPGTGDPALIRDNVLVSRTGVPVVTTVDDPAGGPNVLLNGNAYASTAGPAVISYRGTTYAGLAAFRAGTGQERAGGADTGVDGDPRLAGALDAPAPVVGGMAGVAGLAPYRPAAGSPLVDAGVSTAHAGSTDVFGAARLSGAAEDIGAVEVGPAPVAHDAPAGPVAQPAHAPAPGAPASTPPATDAPAAPAAPVPVVGRRAARGIAVGVSSRVRISRRSAAVRVTLRCLHAAPCTGRLTLSRGGGAGAAGALSGRLASARFRLTRVGARTVALRLPRSLLRSVRGGRRVAVVLAVRADGVRAQPRPRRLTLTAAR